MTYILFGLGILFILLGFIDIFPKAKQSYLDAEELYKWQKQKSEVNQAKADLIELMDELKKVSDQVVENIEYKVKEAQNLNISKETPHLQTKVNLNPAKNKDEKKKTPNPAKVDKGLEKPKNHQEFAEILSTNLKEDNPPVDKHTYIYQLAKEGLSIEEIAQKVQVGKGEVELIIGIKRRGEQA